jgi:modulator of FtsH protease
MQPSQPSAFEKLSGTIPLSATRSAVIRQTYLLLGVAVAASLAGGYIGATSETIVGFFTTTIGWLVAIVLLNAVPWVAMACRHNPALGVAALVADGFIGGLAISPLLWFAAQSAPVLILAALMITTAVFLAITGYIWTTKREFSAPKGLMIGMFVAIAAAIALNMFMSIGWLGVLISAGIGIMGVFGLVFSTSGVLRSPDADSPIPGALALYAGLFNIFVATLNILLRVMGGGRRN